MQGKAIAAKVRMNPALAGSRVAQSRRRARSRGGNAAACAQGRRGSR